jgi:hypothetical protein
MIHIELIAIIFILVFITIIALHYRKHDSLLLVMGIINTALWLCIGLINMDRLRADNDSVSRLVGIIINNENKNDHKLKDLEHTLQQMSSSLPLSDTYKLARRDMRNADTLPRDPPVSFRDESHRDGMTTYRQQPSTNVDLNNAPSIKRLLGLRNAQKTMNKSAAIKAVGGSRDKYVNNYDVAEQNKYTNEYGGYSTHIPIQLNPKSFCTAPVPRYDLRCKYPQYFPKVQSPYDEMAPYDDQFNIKSIEESDSYDEKLIRRAKWNNDNMIASQYAARNARNPHVMNKFYSEDIQSSQSRDWWEPNS